jgi:outer membrane protein assembly factor BamE
MHSSCSFTEIDDSNKSSILVLLEKSTPKWLTPYKADIVQGNYISEGMILRLKKGQTKKEVMIILGTPLLMDPFNPNRWDYVFDIKKNEGVEKNRIFFVEFVDDKLFKWQGNPVENSLESFILPN